MIQREPTGDAVQRGVDAYREASGYSLNEKLRRAWFAMYDHATDNKPKPAPVTP